MSIEAKIQITVRTEDWAEFYTVLLYDTMSEREVEFDCKSQAAAETLMGVLMVTGSDVEIKPSVSIKRFAPPLRAEPGEKGEKPVPA